MVDSKSPAAAASNSSPPRASALQFVSLARQHKLHLFIKVFREAGDLAWAKKMAAADGAPPAAMMAAMLLKKEPTKSQTTQITKTGFIAVPIEFELEA